MEKLGYLQRNEFEILRALRAMPKVRLFGNSGLSFLVKAASGYWNLMDPTNGYTPINKHSLEELDLDSLAKRYFLRSDMLINLNIEKCCGEDVKYLRNMEMKRGSLSITKTHLVFRSSSKGLFKRIF